MTAPSPSNLYNPPGSSIDRTSGSTPPRPQQAAWGPSQQSLGRRVLAPLSTTVGTGSSRTAGSHSPRSQQDRNPWSPVTTSTATSFHQHRHNNRSSSITSTSSPFSPTSSSQQQALLGSLLSSSRPRATGSSAGQQSSTIQPTQALGTGGSSSAGSVKNYRSSPSLAQSAFSSPTGLSNLSGQPFGQSGSLSKIAIAQVFLLLSTMKEDKDGSKANQVMKVCCTIFVPFTTNNADNYHSLSAKMELRCLQNTSGGSCPQMPLRSSVAIAMRIVLASIHC